MTSHNGRMKPIKHETDSYNVKQAQKHLKHHKSTKLLSKQIKSRLKGR